jgi:molecular chaperone HscB
MALPRLRTLVAKASRQVEDHFRVLGLPHKFDINSKELKQTYLEQMELCHPDKFACKSEQERANAEEQSANITHAFKIISHPQTRAVHLLDLLGKPLEEDKDFNLLAPDFLMEVMETREELEAAPSAERMREMREENAQRIEGLVSDLSTSFGVHRLDEARLLTAKLRYAQRVEDEIRDRID